MKTIKTLAIIITSMLLFSSCEKEIKIEQIYQDLEMLADWQDFEIGEDEEIIFKLTITNETGIDLDWQDIADMKDDESFTGDIKVSAYRPDGITPYFEDADNGFKENARLIEIEDGDTQVIIIVTAKEGKAGTFTIRARGKYDDLVVTDPKTINFGEWTDKNITEGEFKWLTVDCVAETDIEVMWQELDQKEAGTAYDSDVKVSVYSEDLSVVYVDDKNHGFNEPRTFTLESGSSSILYIRVTGVVSGSYAIRVSGQTK